VNEIMIAEELETLYWAAEILDREGFVRIAGQVREAFWELGGSEAHFE